MDTKPLEKFAQAARRQLQTQVKAKLEQVLRTDSAELRAKAPVVAELNKQIARSSRAAVVEQVAYTWFNRFCALRYMDANRYTRIGVVSPAPGNTQPEILQEAKQGHIDADLLRFVDSQRVLALLAGRLASADAQGEAYRLLLVGSCNQYHAIMPFLFEPIDDYTELLMPDDLLSAGSVVAAARAAMTEEACADVEVIGWLYQFYISEKKDEVIGAKKAIAPQNIPAATQLFTPDWIVRYLVQNSLGRLWLLNRPSSRLAEKMEFYISDQYSVNSNQSDPNTDNRLLMTDYLKINSPEELTICDPAVGSGHMLTYAFDLLYAIYEEEGYNPPDIPRLILQQNLTGLEIDERAANLAAFALVMKARAKDRRFFNRGVSPQITVLRPIVFTDEELTQEVNHLLNMSFRAVPGEESFALAEGKDSSLRLSLRAGSKTPRNDMLKVRNDMEEALRHDLNLFREADNVGSLLRPRLSAAQLTSLRHQLAAAAPSGQLHLFDQQRRQKVEQAISQAIPLARQYTVMIANPPYMGSKNINDSLKKFANTNYPDSKSDLFAMFIERGFDLVVSKGYNAMVTMQSWMFLSSYEKLREKLLASATIDCMVHMDNMVMGIAFGTAATVWQKAYKPDYKGHFSYVYYEDLTTENRPHEFPVQNERLARAAATDFKKIPGFPIAYWISNNIRNTFLGTPLETYIITEGQNKTANNDLYLRLFWEIDFQSVGEGKKWLPYAKGGSYRKWYGNIEYVINWSEEARTHYRKSTACRIIDKRFWSMEGITWTDISSSGTGFRYFPKEATFDMKGPTAFISDGELLNPLLSLLNSNFVSYLLPILNPTMSTQLRDIRAIPMPKSLDWIESATTIANNCQSISKQDWYNLETTLSFETHPIFLTAHFQKKIAESYRLMSQHWKEKTLEIQRLEEENNRLFIAAYGLQDELTPDVPLAEITLTCNPHYRYSSSKSAAELETLLLADTMREFISYAVGCMFGRYSLDKPGLILANQGETVEEYVRKVGESEQYSVISNQSDELNTDHWSLNTLSFMPDADNAIPMLDGDWFTDDISERFKKFLRLTFGEAHYAENLAFIEAALGRDIRGYFLRDFYNHHVKMYKKRPIYWLFSSDQGSFNVLIYMHRYRPDTVSVILNDYLREFRTKLTARKSYLEGVAANPAAASRDRTQAVKEVGGMEKVLKEIGRYEDEVLYPLATRQLTIDLDDGVKVNYKKFGPALKKVAGLSG